MFREVLAGGLLVALVPGAWGAGGSGQPPEPATPEGCVQSPAVRCVIRLSLAAVEEIADADARAEALARIAEAQANAGESGEARKNLSRALAAVDAIDAAAYDWGKISPEDVAFGEQARVLSLIARVQADMGDTGRARETFSRAAAVADAIETGSTRSAALIGVARMQVAAGRLPEARQTIARADLADYAWNFPGFELPALVRAQAEAGDVAGALVTARTLPGYHEHDPRFAALAQIAAVQAATGDEPGALMTAEEILRGSLIYYMETKHHIGIARAERGDVAGAWATVRTFQMMIPAYSLLRDGARAAAHPLTTGMIAAIAEARLAKGEFGKAFAAIMDEDMEDDFTFVAVRMAIAKARIAAGRFDAARGDAEALCDGDRRYHYACVEALADLAGALVAAGRADESREAASMALDEADGVVYDPDRTQAFVAAYTALMRVGDVEAARRAFSSALAAATAEENEGAYWQAEEFIRLGAAAAREGDSDSADRLAASGEMGLQTLVLTGLVWTRAGDADVARAMFSRAVATATRAEALAEIAFALASGRWPAADDYPGYFQ